MLLVSNNSLDRVGRDIPNPIADPGEISLMR